jgi:nitroreductase
MNETISILTQRRSIRSYSDQEITAEEKKLILQATLQSATAGNMMLYTIIEITDQAIKDRLAVTCDNQPFIAKAPWILLFLADYQRWFDYYRFSGVEKKCVEKNIPFRKPGVGDLMLACCDTLIAAQTSVVAAESLGIGSCYIGDILERYEDHQQIFNLPQYVLPITMVCFGRTAQPELNGKTQPRFPQEFVVHQNQYQSLQANQVDALEKPHMERYHAAGKFPDGIEKMAQQNFFRKFVAEFSLEMNRSVTRMLENWKE